MELPARTPLDVSGTFIESEREPEVVEVLVPLKVITPDAFMPRPSKISFA